MLKNLFEEIADGTLDPRATELLNIVGYMQTRFTKGDRGKIIIDTMGDKAFAGLQRTLRANNIFIWSKGELKNYYKTEVKQLGGSKDIKALQLSYILNEDDQTLESI